jgi:hypothetical protein
MVLAGLGAVLILALAVHNADRLFGGRVGVRVVITTTATEMLLISPTSTGVPTKTADPTVTPVTASPTMTPRPPTSTPVSEPKRTPFPAPARATTEEPVPTAGGALYCIPASENPAVSPTFPANAVDPETCEAIGTSIPVGEEVWMASETVYQACPSLVIIEVTYDNRGYWIVAHRIGRQSGRGKCEPIEDWRDFFGEPRE